MCVSDDDFQSAPEPAPSSLPAGPSTYAEVSRWPFDMLKRATSEGVLSVERLHDLFGGGVLINRDYSGYDCPREMLTQLWKAFAIEKLFSTKPTLTFARSCDNAKLPLRVLLHLAQDVDLGSCVATDIEGCLTPVANNHLDAIINVARDGSYL